MAYIKVKESKEWFWEKYINQKMSCISIAKLLCVTPTTILYRLGKFKIPRRKPWALSRGRFLAEKSSNWKGGKIKTSGGRFYIYSPNHPYRVKSKYVAEHRLNMEKKLGRYLYPWEIVHHINGIKEDNRIENLELLPKEEHNNKVQEVYQENLQLKKTNFILFSLLSFAGGKGAI